MNLFLTLSLYGGFWKQQKKIRDSQIQKKFWVFEEALSKCRERIVRLRAIYDSAASEREKFSSFSVFVAVYGFDPETGFRIG